MTPEYLAQCIADNIRLMKNIDQLPRSDKTLRLANKAVERHARLLAWSMEIDPEMEAIANNEAIQSDAHTLFTHGTNLVEEFFKGAEHVSANRRYDLRAIAFTMSYAFDNIEDFMTASGLAVIAAYAMGREDGLNTKLHFSVIPANKLGTD